MWIKNVDYVVIPELPKEYQKPFRKWLGVTTMPVVPAEGKNKNSCAFKHKYELFLEHLNKQGL